MATTPHSIICAYENIIFWRKELLISMFLLHYDIFKTIQSNKKYYILEKCYDMVR